jgi:hypothetical protein
MEYEIIDRPQLGEDGARHPFETGDSPLPMPAPLMARGQFATRDRERKGVEDAADLPSGEATTHSSPLQQVVNAIWRSSAHVPIAGVRAVAIPARRR